MKTIIMTMFLFITTIIFDKAMIFSKSKTIELQQERINQLELESKELTTKYDYSVEWIGKLENMCLGLDSDNN